MRWCLHFPEKNFSPPVFEVKNSFIFGIFGIFGNPFCPLDCWFLWDCGISGWLTLLDVLTCDISPDKIMNFVLFCSWQWRILRSLRRSTESPRMKRKISWRHMLVRLSFYTFAVKINSCFLNYIGTPYLHLASYLRISYLCIYDLYGPVRNGSGSTWIRIGLAPWIWIRIEIKIWIRIRDETSADPQYWYKVQTQ